MSEGRTMTQGRLIMMHLLQYGTITQMLTVYRYGDLNVTGEDYAGTVLAKAEEYRK